MLVEFTVENYKSFRDRTTLSMVAAKITSFEKSLDEENVIDAKPDLKLLRSAGIYGANASGKSNLASALGFMRSFVIGSARELQAEDPINIEPFLLNTATENEASLFEIVFIAWGVEYRYGFQVTQTKVTAEWLFASYTTRETTLFTRDEQKIKCGAKFPEGKGLQSKTRQNALYLSIVAQFNGQIAIQILSWFQSLVITSGLHDMAFERYLAGMLVGEKSREKMKKIANDFDLGIESFNLVKDKFPSSEFSIFTTHSVENNEGERVGTKQFSFENNESEGTRKILSLIGRMQFTSHSDSVWLIDELDAHLHALITRAIIKLFNSHDTNPGSIQLIFITHDTNLLDKSLLRRDQVWFAEKDRQGSTHLASLVEYNVRNDESFEKNYIQGRYGAIPFLGDLTRLPVATDV